MVFHGLNVPSYDSGIILYPYPFGHFCELKATLIGGVYSYQRATQQHFTYMITIMDWPNGKKGDIVSITN